MLDFSLSLLSVATEVQVTEEAPVLQTEAGNVGTTINAQTIDELPLVQRDVTAVVCLIKMFQWVGVELRRMKCCWMGR